MSSKADATEGLAGTEAYAVRHRKLFSALIPPAGVPCIQEGVLRKATTSPISLCVKTHMWHSTSVQLDW